MMLAKDLKTSVIESAIKGNLSFSLVTDTEVIKTLENISIEKKKLISSRQLKKEPLSNISEDEIPFEIPNTWLFVRLGEVIKLTSGQDLTSDRYSEKNVGIPYLTGASNFKKGKLFINRYTETPTSVAYKDDLLITCKGTIGEIAFLKEEKAHIARQIMAIKPFANINIDYIKLWLEILVDTLNAKAKSIIPGIDRKTILNCVISLPPIEEQARIVAKVDEIMAKIDEYEKLEKQLDKLNKDFPGDMKDAVLLSIFQGLDVHSNFEDVTGYDYLIPNEWDIKQLKDISNIYTGNSIPESIKKAKYTGITDGYDYIGTKDVGFSRCISYNNGVRIPYDEPKFRYAYKGATLLCVEGGSAGKKIGMIDRQICFGNKLCSFNPNNEINAKYLYYFLQSPIFTKVFKTNISGMIGGVSVNKIKSMFIPLPALKEQQRIVDLLDKVLPLCDDLNKLAA